MKNESKQENHDLDLLKTFPELGALISIRLLQQIIESQDNIMQLLQSGQNSPLKENITEKEAMQIINKRSTWFWQKRKSGELKFQKIGRTTYYRTDDIRSLVKTPKPK